MKSWYLIHTKPRQEKLAEENLKRQGYKTYLPLAPVRRRKKGKTVRIIEAMFPRYLFIYLSDKTDDWRPIRSTIGVTNLVKFGQLPAKIPKQLISDLKTREDYEGIQPLNIKNFNPGDKVLIAEGPLEGYEGLFQCNSGKERVILLLKIAQSAVKMTLESSQIEQL